MWGVIHICGGCSVSIHLAPTHRRPSAPSMLVSMLVSAWVVMAG